MPCTYCEDGSFPFVGEAPRPTVPKAPENFAVYEKEPMPDNFILVDGDPTKATWYCPYCKEGMSP